MICAAFDVNTFKRACYLNMGSEFLMGTKGNEGRKMTN